MKNSTARKKSTLESDTEVATVWTYLQTDWQSKAQTVFFLIMDGKNETGQPQTHITDMMHS